MRPERAARCPPSHDVMTPTAERHFRAGLLLLAALGLALRLALLVAVPAPTPVSDGWHFHRIAISLLEGRGFGEAPGHVTAHRAPLQSFWLLALYSLAGTS